MVITVDGPAAAGKSTVARQLARRLGFQYLDTGAMYRAVTWKALRTGVDLADAQGLSAMAGRTCVELLPDAGGAGGSRVLCDGRDVTAEIRTPEVTESIYRLADEPGVRRVLIEQQRRMADGADLVAEGRDQGTDVFPDAEAKFYLDASIEERARRRLSDLRADGREADLDEVVGRMAERDAKDRSRPVGALCKCGDMVVVDSTEMTVDEVVEAMVAEIRRRRSVPDTDRE